MLRYLIVVCLSWLTIATAPALAEARDAEAGALLLTADALQYDQELGLVVATGHVQISQGLRTLLADTVTYNSAPTP